jgi:hypothetical protein
MGNEQVNLSTEHQYWRVMRDFVEPAVRALAERESMADSNVIIDRESLVLDSGEKYYSFDASLKDDPLQCWRFSYVLECEPEEVRMEAVRPDYPYMEPLVLCRRSVDDYDSETAMEDIKAALERILEIEDTDRE